MFCYFEKITKKKPLTMSENHSHKFYEIYFLLDGDRYFIIENDVYKITPLTFIMLPPGVMHSTAGNPYTKINIYYSPDYLSEQENAVFNKILSNKVIVTDESIKPYVLEILQKIEKYSKSNSAEKSVFTKSLMLSMLYLMCGENSTKIQPIECRKNSDSPPILDEMIKYIQENLHTDLTLETVSKIFAVSSSYLCKLFHKYLGISVHKYITNHRIQKACHLLINSKKSLDQIAEECGFGTANYFSMTFKKNTGFSPLKYKNFEQEKDKNEL